jgi:hypothetical protein
MEKWITGVVFSQFKVIPAPLIQNSSSPSFTLNLQTVLGYNFYNKIEQ